MSLRDSDYTEQECFDYDVAHVDFWDWFQDKAEEQHEVHESTVHKTRDRYVMVRRYETQNQILALYGTSKPRTVSAVDDPDVLAVDIDALLTDFVPYGAIDDDE